MPRPGRMTTERAKDFKGTLRQLLPVSYTHLDVYKRQLVVGTDELFVRKGQGHSAVGVNGEAAHDLCIVGLVLVGLIHDVARRHIRHGQAFGQLVGQGIVGGRQHTGIQMCIRDRLWAFSWPSSC